jgi:D-glycero-D-manno-heptose 1,7-bisphosphate phosphatase
MNKAVFLDRDGVINQKPKEGEYITSWEDFHILPGVAEAIALLNGAGYMVVVVTNQRCVAKGLLSVADLEMIHQQMSEALSRTGAKLDGIYFCPHDYEPACHCRKPAPGMLLKAAQVHGINLRSSWMVGDSEIDIQAGKSAGCKTARVSKEREKHTTDGDTDDIFGRVEINASSLLDSARRILESDSKRTIEASKRKVTA